VWGIYFLILITFADHEKSYRESHLPSGLFNRLFYVLLFIFFVFLLKFFIVDAAPEGSMATHLYILRKGYGNTYKYTTWNNTTINRWTKKNTKKQKKHKSKHTESRGEKGAKESEKDCLCWCLHVLQLQITGKPWFSFRISHSHSNRMQS
jgi:hypothetical protein